MKECRVCHCVLVIGENYLESNIEYGIYICRDCAKIKLNEFVDKNPWYKFNTKIDNRKVFLDTMGNKCACCTEDIWQFMTLDHINNDGCEDRRGNSNPFTIGSFSRMKDDMDLSRYQMLCMNCNFCKGHNGFCPHALKTIRDNCAICSVSLSVKNWMEPLKTHDSKICNDCLINNSVQRKGFSPTKQSKVIRKRMVLTLKQLIVENYGGKCECCHETELMFLTIDHIKGGGRKENKQLSKAGSDFYRHLKLNGYPKDNYRLLCYNCNCCREVWGQCYHELCRQQNTTEIGIEQYRSMVISGEIQQ